MSCIRAGLSTLSRVSDKTQKIQLLTRILSQTEPDDGPPPEAEAKLCQPQDTRVLILQRREYSCVSHFFERFMRHGQLVDDVQDAGENSELLGECFTLVIFPISAALLTAGQLQAKVMLTLPVGRNRDRIKYSATACRLNGLDQENNSLQI